MKQIEFDGQSRVTGTDVADALIVYAESAARMATSTTVEIPVLEANGNVVMHSILINPATALQTVDVDGEVEGEAERFPLPSFTPVGGKAVPVDTEDVAEISVAIGE